MPINNWAKLYTLLIYWEGWRNHVYLDGHRPNAYRTTGVGYNMEMDQTIGGVTTSVLSNSQAVFFQNCLGVSMLPYYNAPIIKPTNQNGNPDNPSNRPYASPNQPANGSSAAQGDPNPSLSNQQVYDLLVATVNNAIADISANSPPGAQYPHIGQPYWNNLNEDRQIALLDMYFNMGAAKFFQFKSMISAIRAGNWTEAANQVEYSNPPNPTLTPYYANGGVRAQSNVYALQYGSFPDNSIFTNDQVTLKGRDLWGWDDATQNQVATNIDDNGNTYIFTNQNPITNPFPPGSPNYIAQAIADDWGNINQAITQTGQSGNQTDDQGNQGTIISPILTNTTPININDDGSNYPWNNTGTIFTPPTGDQGNSDNNSNTGNLTNWIINSGQFYWQLDPSGGMYSLWQNGSLVGGGQNITVAENQIPDDGTAVLGVGGTEIFRMPTNMPGANTGTGITYWDIGDNCVWYYSTDGNWYLVDLDNGQIDPNGVPGTPDNPPQDDYSVINPNQGVWIVGTPDTDGCYVFNIDNPSTDPNATVASTTSSTTGSVNTSDIPSDQIFTEEALITTTNSTDTAGNTLQTVVTTDLGGNVLAVSNTTTDNLANSISYAADSAGNVISGCAYTDFAGTTYTFINSTDGSTVTGITYPDGSGNVIFIDSNGDQTTTVTTIQGAQTNTVTTYPDLTTTTTQILALPNGATTTVSTYVDDLFNTTKIVVGPDGSITTTITNALGDSTTTYIGPNGQYMTSQTTFDLNGGETVSNYDSVTGNTVYTSTDAAGNSTSITTNSFGQVISSTTTTIDSDGNTTKTTIDAAGNIKTTTTNKATGTTTTTMVWNTPAGTTTFGLPTGTVINTTMNNNGSFTNTVIYPNGDTFSTTTPGGGDPGTQTPSTPPDVGGGAPTHCFIAGTLVSSEKGPVSIETVKVGDSIYTYDFDLKKPIAQLVEKTLESESDQILALDFGT